MVDMDFVDVSVGSAFKSSSSCFLLEGAFPLTCKKEQPPSGVNANAWSAMFREMLGHAATCHVKDWERGCGILKPLRDVLSAGKTLPNNTGIDAVCAAFFVASNAEKAVDLLRRPWTSFVWTEKLEKDADMLFAVLDRVDGYLTKETNAELLDGVIRAMDMLVPMTSNPEARRENVQNHFGSKASTLTR